MAEFNTIDDFLGHSGSTGRRNQYLKDWKKKGYINIWLHTRRLPLAVWSHQFPTLVVMEDKETRQSTKAYWGRPQNCWEDESFLKVQYKRDSEGKLEEGTPNKCSMCRLVDVVHEAVVKGELSWVDEVLRFEGSTEPKNDQVLFAGGMTGMFNSDKLTDSQKAEMKKHGIYASDSWRQNVHAKLQYVFCLVDQDDVKSGVQIASQTSLVGDKVKKVIRDTQASLGDEEGNPMVNPFCIQLTYDEKAPINARYHARRIEKYKMTPEIERLVRSEAPDLRSSIKKFDQKSMRAYLERHAVVDLPWDRIFDVPTLSEGEEEDAFPPPEEKRESSPRKQVAPKAVPPPPPSSKRAIMIPCDGCKKPMPEDATKCDSCGAVYSFDDDAPPPPPKGKATGAKVPFNRF